MKARSVGGILSGIVVLCVTVLLLTAPVDPSTHAGVASATGDGVVGSGAPSDANASTAGNDSGGVATAAEDPAVTIVTHSFETGRTTNRSLGADVRTAGTPRHAEGSFPSSVSASNYSAVVGEMTDGRERIENTRSYPWSAIAQIQIYLDEETGVCSGTLIDDNHVLTAAHCVYHHDKGGWAQGLTVSPGTNLQAIYEGPYDKLRGAIHPFGQAEAVRVQTYERWIDGTNRGFDMAVVTLDRSVGEFTGTFGYAGYPGSNDRYRQPAHATGYPSNPPKDPVLTMWDDYGDGGGTSSLAFLPDLGCLGSNRCHALSMTLSEGQSGGPVWQAEAASADRDTPFVLSVNAAGYSAFGVPISLLPTTGVRITDGKFGDIEDMIDNGDALHSPTDRPDLRRAGARYRGLSREQVTANESVLSVQVGVLNRGTETPGSFDVTYRAVSTTGGESVRLGTESVSGVAPFREVANVTWSGTVPRIEAGTYRIVANLDSSDTVREFREAGNVTVGQLTVTAGGENTSLVSTDGAFTTEDPFVDDNLDPLEGYYDGYSIYLEEGDVLNAEVRPEKSHENPTSLVLHQPDGDFAVRSNSGPEDGDAVFSEHRAEETGTYTLYVTSDGREDTFGYHLDAYYGRPADFAVGYGADINGRIDASDYYLRGDQVTGYYDVVKFEGEAGDVVNAEVRPGKSHENDAEIVLYQPDGDYATSPSNGDEGDAVLSRYTLQENGTYRLVIGNDRSSSNEFDYDLSLYEGLPADRRLAYGTTLTDRINDSDRYLFDSFEGYHDVYAFEGRAGDRVSAELRPEKSHENTGRLLLFQPDGDRVAFEQSNGEEGDAVLSRHTLRENGTYRLVAASDGRDQFPYELRFYEGLPTDGRLDRGETVGSEIDTDDRYLNGEFEGYHETYAFDAAGGETVSIELRPRSEIDHGELRLYDPNGNLLTRENGGAGDNAVISRFTLPDTDGTYRVVGTSALHTETFGFDLSLYGDLPPDANLTYGESTTGSVSTTDRYLTGDPDGYHDVYAFEGEAGDRVSVELRADDAYEDQSQILLYGPGGELIERDRADAEGNDAVVSLNRLEKNGTHKIVVTGDLHQDTFDYDLRLFEGLTVVDRLGVGESVESEIDASDRYLQGDYEGYHETYAFDAAGGETVSVELRPEADIRGGELRLYGPADKLLTTEDGGAGDDAVISRYALPNKSGPYRVVATSVDHTEKFNFTLSLYGDLPADATLTYGESVTGSVSTADRFLTGDPDGYHDVYAFEGEAGERVSVELRANDDYDDQSGVVLFGPGGTLLRRQYGNAEGNDAVISLQPIATNGTYRVVVTGDRRADTFAYDLRLFEGVSVNRRLPDDETLRRHLDPDDRFLEGNPYNGYHEVFTFAGAAGETVSIEVRPDNASENTADVTLYQPDGDEAADDYSGGDAGNAVIGRHTLEESGQYRLVVTGAREADTFRYDVSRYTGLPAEESLLYGDSLTGQVTTDDEYLNGRTYHGYHDVLVFNGSAGEVISMNLTAISDPDANPHLSLLEPDGDVFDRETGYDGTASLVGRTLPESGEYRIVVSSRNTRGLEYRFNLSGPDNNPPRAIGNATPNIVAAGNSVVLDASVSNDPDGDALTYRWSQRFGPSVTLRDPNTSRAQFVAPNASDGTTLTFVLAVTDSGGKVDTAEVTVTVRNSTDRPVVRAGTERGAVDYVTPVNATLTEAPTGVAGFVVVAQVTDPGVGRIVGGSVADAFGGTNVTVGPDGETLRLAGVDFDELVEPGATDIRLGQVRIEGHARGETGVSLRVVRLDDDRGGAVTAGVSAGVFRVPSVEPVVPPNSPGDPDRDGRYEDVNGNDRADIDDAVELFRHLDDPAVTGAVGAYDFNDNGEVESDDAVELFNEVVGAGDTLSVGTTGAEVTPATAGSGDEVNPTARTDSPRVNVSNGTVEPDGTTTVSVTLSGAPDGLAGFDLRIRAENGSVVNMTGAGSPELFTPSRSVIGPANASARIVAADFEAEVAAGASDVRLATVTIAAERAGESDLSATLNRIDDDDGGPVTAVASNGTATVAPRDSTSCLNSVVSGDDNTISLTEIQRAINWWAESVDISETGGTISLPEIQSLINAWAEGLPVSCG